MTRIDIDRLSEAELVDLHHRIVERLRFLEQMRAHARCSISVSATGCVSSSGSHGLIEGILTRYNKRTVTVITDDRRQWNVSPGLLRKANRPDTAQAAATNVIRLK